MFKVITKEEYLTRLGTTAVEANPLNGIPEKTYLHYNFSDCEGDARSFTQGYWAGVNEMKRNTEDTLQLNRLSKHAANYGVAEQSCNSQATPEEEKKDILEERRGTHGDFKDVAPISQTLKIYFRAQSTWDALTFVQQEALDNIAQKIARIFAGNHNFADHWVDIQGYAKLAQQEIEKNGDRSSSLK